MPQVPSPCCWLAFWLPFGCSRCVLSPDVSRLITCSSDKTVRVWSLPGGATRPSFQLEKTLAQHTRWVWDACFSADSAYLVTASSDWTARLWDVHTGEVNF